MITLRSYSGEVRSSMKLSSPTKISWSPNGVTLKDRKPEGIKGRPEEKDQDDDQLRGDQGIREPAV